MSIADDGIDDLVATLRAHARIVDHDGRFPDESLNALRQAGLLGLLVPKRYGGMEASLLDFVQVAQRLAGGCMSSALVWAMHCQQVDAIVRHASSELAERILPKVASGVIYLASVTTERAGGRTFLNAEAPIVEETEHLSFVRDAPVVTGGACADGFLITLRRAESAGVHEVSLVYADRADLRLSETSSWHALGMRGTHSVGLRIQGRVPRGSLIGPAGQFHQIATDSMTPMAHLSWSACWLGAARERFTELVTWLRDPARRGGPDVRSDLTRERLARIRLDLELVHAYLLRAVDEVTADRASGPGQRSTAVQIHLNMLKLAASDLSFRAVDGMIALAGLAKGYMTDSAIPLERSFRDLRSAALNYSNDRLWTETGSLVLLDRKGSLL